MVWCRVKSDSEYECSKRKPSPGHEWLPLEDTPVPGSVVRLIGGALVVTPPAQPKDEANGLRRRTIVAAIPDILLAVADGADLREELQKVLGKVEVPSGER